MDDVDISAIITDGRTLRPGDDVTDLAKHISEHGQRAPILLDSNWRLIDGLRRIEAVWSLGQTHILADRVTTYDEVIVNLRQAFQDPATTQDPALLQRHSYERRWDIYSRAMAMTGQTRSVHTRGLPRHSRGIKISFREHAWRPLGFRNDAELQAFVALFRLRGKPNVPQSAVNEAIALLEQGELTVHGALRRARLSMAPQGHINNLAEQRSALQGITSSMHGMNRVLDQMGRLNPRLDKEEVATYLQEMATFRSTLSRFIRQTTEENNQR